MDDQIGGFERPFGTSAATDPEQMGQLHTGIARREGIEVTAGVDERAEFGASGSPGEDGV